MPRAKINAETGLTEKQEKFALAYFETGNATEAYRRSYGVKSAKPATVHRQAKALSDNPKIQARIEALRDASAQRAELRKLEVLRGLATVCFFDLRRLFTEDGTVKPVQEWPEEVAAAVASLVVREVFQGRGKDRKLVGYTKTVRFCDRGAALASAMEYLGLFGMKDREQPAKMNPKVTFVKSNAREKGA